MTEPNKTEKSFKITTYAKIVKGANGNIFWRLRIPLNSMPPNTLPTVNGSVIFQDNVDLYCHMKKLLGVDKMPDEYYSCEYKLNEYYLEFWGLTEPCVRLGLREYLKRFHKNLHLSIARQWTLTGIMNDSDSDSESEDGIPSTIFFDEEEW